MRRSSLHQATVSGQGLNKAIVSGQRMHQAIVSGQCLHQAAVSGQVPHQAVIFGQCLHWAVVLGHWLPCTVVSCQILHYAQYHRNKHKTNTFSMQTLHKFLLRFFVKNTMTEIHSWSPQL